VIGIILCTFPLKIFNLVTNRERDACCTKVIEKYSGPQRVKGKWSDIILQKLAVPANCANFVAVDVVSAYLRDFYTL
jgi:hypothetical protein